MLVVEFSVCLSTFKHVTFNITTVNTVFVQQTQVVCIPSIEGGGLALIRRRCGYIFNVADHLVLLNLLKENINTHIQKERRHGAWKMIMISGVCLHFCPVDDKCPTELHE